MKKSKIIDKLEKLTNEADMLTEVLDDALKKHEHREGITLISFLSDKVRKKFEKIRILF